MPNEDFITVVRALGASAESIDGHMRWVVTLDTGEKYIVRPIEAKPND